MGINAMKHAVVGSCMTNKTVNARAYMGTVAGMCRYITFILEQARTQGQTDVWKVLNISCYEHHHQNLIAIDTQGDVFFHTGCVNGLSHYVMSDRCQFGLGPNLENPITRRGPAVLHAPGGLSLD